jgi:chromosome segregation ATPase
MLTLRQMSWLNNTTADPSVAPLLAEINRLQRELDRANESVDDKLDRLEDAGHGVIGLTRQLSDARAKIVVLEEQLARLGRRETRRLKRLERARCGKCRTKMDLRHLERAAVGDERQVLILSDIQVECMLT